MADELVAFDKTELRQVFKALKGMSEEAVEEAKRQSGALADYVKSSIVDAAAMRQSGQAVAIRIATGARVKKSSKIGEFSYGFASQRFSGGATTQKLWAGLEFGSNRYRQFPRRTSNRGRGNSGYFIYPTLRKIQPELVRKWEEAFAAIVKKWG